MATLDSERTPSRPPSAARVATTGALLAGTLAGVVVALRRIAAVPASLPIDFNINWIAGRRLLAHQALYDGAAARAQGAELLGAVMRTTGGSPYRSFIGSPFVALQHAPFAALPHDLAVDLFRALSVAALVGGVWFAARALPTRSRTSGVVVGLVALGVMYPTIQTLALGQGNGFVVLGLGVGAWALTRERWTAAGIVFGLVAGLKLALVVLVVYLVARGIRRVALPALVTLVGTTLVAAVLGRPSDLVTWLVDVLPGASQGSSYVGNQSVVGWIARLTGSENHLDLQIPLGEVNRLGPVLMVGLLVVLARSCPDRRFVVQELGVVVLVVLLASPLTWDHYFTWSAFSIVVFCDTRLWDGLNAVWCGCVIAATLVAGWLLWGEIHEPTAREVAASWWVRVESGRYAVAGLLLILVGWTATARASRREQSLPAPAPTSEHLFDEAAASG